MSNPYPIPRQGQNQALVLSLNFFITELCLYSLWHASAPVSRVFLIAYIPVSRFRLACSAFNKILSRWLPNVNTHWSFQKGLKTHFSLGGSGGMPPPPQKSFEIWKVRNAISSDLRQNANTKAFNIFVGEKYGMAPLMSQCDKNSCTLYHTQY